MNPVGQGFGFYLEIVVRCTVCNVSGSMQIGEKKLWEFLSVKLCLQLGKPVIKFLLTKGLLGTNRHFLIFVNIGKVYRDFASKNS